MNTTRPLPTAAEEHNGPFARVDWEAVFVPQTPLLELVVRGTLVYFALFLLLRFVLKRESGALGVTDLLVVVLIADAAQNAMADNYTSVPGGVLLVAVVVFWAWAFDALGYHIPAIQRILKPPKLPLIRNGEMILKNMRREFITREELRSQLREQGVHRLEDVEAAYMEPDGRISVLTGETGQRQSSPRRGVY